MIDRKLRERLVLALSAKALMLTGPACLAIWRGDLMSDAAITSAFLTLMVIALRRSA
jgi:hypothetical protein